MKVLIYGLNYAPEPVGTGKYSGEMAAWLSARGHNIRVIAAPPYFPQWKIRDNRYLRENLVGVSVQRCPLWVPRHPTGLTRLVHLMSFALSSLPPLLNSIWWRPDVVFTIAPSFFCAPGALVLGLLCGKKTHTWLHIQDFELDAAFELGMLKGKLIRNLAERWERSTLQSFDRVSSISGAMVQRAVAKGVAPEKTVYLANWVDTTAIQPQAQERRTKNPYRKELGIDENSLILLYSGSMNKKQGLDILVDVIKKLSDIEGLVWLIAGEGPSKNLLKKETYGMKNVKVLPLQPLERMQDWLNVADIHLLPQKGGAADLVLPSKLMGILASGRPVVASSPKASELGKIAAQAGLRAEPDDSEDFANAARELIENKQLRLRLGNIAREIAEKHYQKERILNSLEAMLEELELEKKLKRAHS